MSSSHSHNTQCDRRSQAKKENKIKRKNYNYNFCVQKNTKNKYQKYENVIHMNLCVHIRAAPVLHGTTFQRSVVV